MTPLGLLLSNALNFTYGINSYFQTCQRTFLSSSSFRLQSYNDFLFLTNFLINFIKI